MGIIPATTWITAAFASLYHAVSSKEHEIPIGGPVTYSLNEIAELALLISGKKRKITHLPVWLVKAAAGVIQPFSKRMSDLTNFFIAASQDDGVAPATGVHTPELYYEELASQ